MCQNSFLLKIHFIFDVLIKILLVLFFPAIFIGCIVFFYVYLLVGKGGIIWTKFMVGNIVAIFRGN